MNLKTIKLVYQRELRDQMRDRRTLFTVLVLPVLIYPLLGMAILHISQFSTVEPCRIWILGGQHIPHDSPLVAEGLFCSGLLSDSERRITVVELADPTMADVIAPLRKFMTSDDHALTPDLLHWAKQQMVNRRYDLAIFVPPVAGADGSSLASMNQIQIIQNSSRSTSVTAALRAQTAVQKWMQNLVVKNLGQLQIQVADVKPFSVSIADVADQASVSAVKWSKALPLIIVIWALTGAFYPAIDLCAGEKERGTLETLLSSPAPRSDIIGGKLLTVMTFSIVTAILNMVSLGISAGLLIGTSSNSNFLGQHFGITLPPLQVLPILLAALIPISALFSALAFAIAAFARSSKEGQYYLLPLMMLTFPLLMLPMLPGMHLSMGTCLIPVSGLIFLLHSIIEGDYGAAATFFGPVCAVTLICCGLALKWSARQFNDESILFRAADQISLRTWLKYWTSRRSLAPTMTQAILCALTILVAKFFGTFLVAPPRHWDEFCRQTVSLLFIAVTLPALVFAFATTHKQWKALRLRMPRPWTLALAGLMAIFLHPIFAGLTECVMWLYPMKGLAIPAEAMMSQLLDGAPGIWAVVLVLAIAPAICEELAFRGYILSGLRSSVGAVPAVLIASLFFSLAHSIVQQSIIAFFVGIVLAVWAIRTESIFPCIVFHAVHNSLTLLFVRIDPGLVAASSWLQTIVLIDDGKVSGYQPLATVLCGLVAIMLALILWRHRVEETLLVWSRSRRRKSPPIAG